MRNLTTGVAFALLVLAGCTTASGPELPVTDIRIGELDLSVWVADDAAERRQGLQGVAELPADIDGMLFTWLEPISASFSMENTLIPLDIWWIDVDGVVVGSARMEPCPDGECVSYRSPSPVGWALETPAGNYGLSAGDTLSTIEYP